MLIEHAISYMIVIIIANTIGSLSGIGGGVIIKPVFDVMGFDSALTIYFYASVAVFVMSIVSTLRQVKSGQRLDGAKLLYLAAGSIFGGYLGSLAFDALMLQFGSQLAQVIQLLITIIVLVWSLLATKQFFKVYHLTGSGWYVSCGLVLGALSSFLGIGGGPINVSLFMLLFSLPIKQATVYSIATIFFSQLSKLLSLVLLAGFKEFDTVILGCIVFSAICGGLLGAKASQLLSEEKVASLFQLVVLLVLLLNVYNISQLLLR